MAKFNSADYAEKWARRTKGASQDLTRGIDNTIVSPSAEAIKKQAKMLQNLVASIQDGSWKKGLEGYSLENWKADMKNKGVPRIAGGVDSAEEYMKIVGEKLAAFQEPILAKIATMPDLTIEDSIARSNYYVREMAKFKM